MSRHGDLTKCNTRLLSILLLVTASAFSACAKTEGTANGGDSTIATTSSSAACAADNGGLTLPDGFCASVFADSIGHGRHIAVNSNGDVYINTWSGEYYQTPAHPGGFLVALRDTNRDGRADVIARFGRNGPAAKSGAPVESTTKTPQSVTGPGAEKSGAGGTGIGIYKGYLYAEEGSVIVRYPLPSDSLAFSGAPETIVSGLPLTGDHPMHPFAIDASGGIYIDLGSASNSCQQKNRTLESPGHRPCTELQTRGGIWRYDANKTNQTFSAAGRYATGIRNAVGIAVGPDGAVYATQHGRDQLFDNWPKLYTAEQGQNLPAEELFKIEQNADYGWPMCYYDGTQQKLVQAPEYGGDGGKAVGDCASKRAPIAFFPAHWAPDGVMFYTGRSFPAHYQGGAFIAFHGSWNRAPGPQGGYQVAFVPFAGGNPANASAYEPFANGFAGGKLQPDAAAHRPVGLAQGPDGSLYISDDKAGRVWRVIYKGSTK
ncbi:MAG TPA: PQQ-dependent sugar dehydrogenase [Gemmatimonadaceae bacterium]|nr:PQQ-dependent sugar dehydrogenase [Gemmatimonadaceae bacterium]